MDNGNRSTGTLPDIRKTMVFNAPINKVWDAIATSEGLAAWFMPNDFKAVNGHEFHLDAGPFGMSPCKVTEVDPPYRLSFNWGKDWTITIELIEQDDTTECTLTHSGWDDAKETEFGQPHSAVRDTMNEGWSGLMQSLDKHVRA